VVGPIGKIVLSPGSKNPVNTSSFQISDGFSVICVSRSPYQGIFADKVLSISCDLSKPNAPEKCFAELDARNILVTYLINNAGALAGKNLHALSLEEIELQIQMNTRFQF
jgi:short-subunit dehydrogenase